jgi:hypothetical protein
MHQDIDLAGNNTETLRVMVLDTARFLSEVDQRVGFVRCGNDPSRAFLVTKEFVRKGDHHSFLQERPVQESPFSNHFARQLRGLDVLEGILDGDDHRDVPAVLSVNIDGVVVELGMMRQCLHRGEASESRSAEVNPVNESSNELDAIPEIRQGIGLHATFTLGQIREGSRKRRGIVVRRAFVVDEQGAVVAQSVSRLLVRSQSVISGCKTACKYDV